LPHYSKHEIYIFYFCCILMSQLSMILGNNIESNVNIYKLIFLLLFPEVYILFEGEAKVKWDESRSRTRNGKTEHYTEHFRGKQTYLNTRTCVFGSGNLPPGTHTYNFCIPLPLECPSSVVGQYGKICYEVSVIIDRQWRFNNVFKQPLTVLQTYNLNMSPELLVSPNDLKNRPRDQD